MTENYENLANAIVIQAVKDYKLYPHKRAEIKDFIKSDWFTELTDINPDVLLKRLNELTRKR